MHISRMGGGVAVEAEEGVMNNNKSVKWWQQLMDMLHVVGLVVRVVVVDEEAIRNTRHT